MKKTILFCTFLSFIFVAKAQRIEDHIKGQILVSLAPNLNPDFLIQKYARIRDISTRLKADEFVSEAMNIWLLSFDDKNVNEQELLRLFLLERDVKIAQFNHYVAFRKKPNDPQYTKQWQWNNTGQTNGTVGADINAEAAWDITTGGLTPTGDTIVVAIIDSGIDHNHQDLKGNIWYNRNEIPNNQIDDDDNGYVDDYRGWNPQDKNDNTQYTTSTHGTVVSGMVGAKGNNNIGVTGVNWNVKIMMIKAPSSWLLNNSEVNVLSAYAYALKMRKLYNQTNGQKGAFIVATNASWGRDNGKAEDSPLWCNFYDTLGVYGILNCGATSNSNVNVDVVGDLPTTCPSNYLISVQASNSKDVNSFSGYGKTHIDLAAPGDAVFSTAPNNSYISQTGTSFASPTVAGAIALMYSGPSKIMNIAKSDPSEAALLVRQALLTGVDVIPALIDQNVTSGRLNLYNAVQGLVALASDCAPPSKLVLSNIKDKEITVAFEKGDSVKQVNLYYRIVPTQNWSVIKNIQSPYVLSGLIKCSTYEIQLESKCKTDSTKNVINTFKTQGCCEAPTLTSKEINKNNAIFQWNSIFGAQKYEVRWRENTAWTSATTSATQFTINGLDSCTTYEVQIRTLCDTTTAASTAFSASLKIKTTGCGACLDLNYCTPSANASFEWIKKVIFNTLSNQTLGSANGYSLSTKKTTVNIGSNYNLEIKPGYGFSTSDVQFMAWIDYNQDGDFNDAGEIVFNPLKTVNDTTIAGIINIPWTAKAGATRLRVGMKAILNNDPLVAFSSCDNSTSGNTFFGEFEDYCITLNSSFQPCAKVDKVTFNPTPNKIIMQWDTIKGSYGYDIYYREKGILNWSKEVSFIGNYQLNVPDCKEYEIMVRNICDNDLSGFTNIETIKSNCTINAKDNQLIFEEVKVYPNPFDVDLNVSFRTFTAENITLSIYNSIGQIVAQKTINQLDIGNHNINLDNTANLVSGVYYLKISAKKGDYTAKLVKL